MTAPVTAVWPGRSYPLGATWDGSGVNFALFSKHAEAVELCLFEASGRRELQRIALVERTGDVWHAYLPEARPGLLYGYRVRGPYRPEDGHRFNPNKLLLDPYAKELAGDLRWSDVLYGYTPRSRREDLSFDRRDSAPAMPKCRVIDTAFTWGDDRRPGVPWRDTVIYEAHVRGLTKLHPEVPPTLRGTYSALASPPMIEHFRRLGVTTVELLPVQAFFDERPLRERGLRNFWGYNPIAYFAPEKRYAAANAVLEFKSTVRALHAAGLEVIIDVVYNHTAEGNERGPTLAFRGIDQAAYYRLDPADRRRCLDFTGCGNTLNAADERVLQLVMDSLRYWVAEMHVDGFRFDLATTLGRGERDFGPDHPFFAMLRQDPVLARAKLIAEPWDLGPQGYRTGGFPSGWAEWNDRWRDGVRSYWRGDAGRLGEIAQRFTGSADLFAGEDRGPLASINYVTAHDGFTLADLVSYERKRNEANGEDNRDGSDNNLSWNCGVEGPSTDAGVLALRERQKRNFVFTLALSLGVPMLTAGDELGRSYGGNNNPYCQDNETTWIDWSVAEGQAQWRAFVERMFALRRAHPALRRSRFFTGRAFRDEGLSDIVWLRPDGAEMTSADWQRESGALGVLISGKAPAGIDDRGQPLVDKDLLVLLNASGGPVEFRLPGDPDSEWRRLVDTALDDPFNPAALERSTVPLAARSAQLYAREAR